MFINFAHETPNTLAEVELPVASIDDPHPVVFEYNNWKMVRLFELGFIFLCQILSCNFPVEKTIQIEVYRTQQELRTA